MARMPAATWLGEHSPQVPMTRYDIVCVHTIVGYAPAHAAHFSVRANGQILQSRDTAYRSAANLEGNHRIIAIENEDHGPAFGEWGGSRVPALTDAQVESNARILRWAHETHEIPLKLAPNSRPASQGLAYHRQGIDGNFDDFRYPGRVAGGEVWTLSFGKICPGDARIAQLADILTIARGEDMALDRDDIDKIARAVWNTDLRAIGGDNVRAGRLLVQTHNRAKVAPILREIAADLDETATAEQVQRANRRVKRLLETIEAEDAEEPIPGE